MSAHCLIIALGPVQDFIAQSRRMRDLWFGSHLLSEVCRGAAAAVAQGGGTLVFPALVAGDPELAPCMAQLRPSGTPPLNVANKIVAEVPDGVDPRSLALAARDAANAVVRAEGDRVRKSCRGLLASGVDDVWNEQLATVLEFYASWAPVRDGGYAGALSAAEAGLAARKNLRDFRQWKHQRGAVPKSSFDGLRETVLAPPSERAADTVARYRIGDGEQLDAVGLVKRCGGQPDQFVPLANVAFVPWLAAAHGRFHDQLASLRSACDADGIGRVHRPDISWTAAFPFDAQVLLRDRWAQVLSDAGSNADPETWGNAHVAPLLRQLGTPSPYVACLAADGDNMGAAISALEDADAHRRFSLALAKFAGSARNVVETQFNGLLVYSGGDDVLAFVNVRDSIPCAEALAESFATCMRAAGLSPTATAPTLSVGVGIGHVLTPLGELLELGRRAESVAKNGRSPRDASRNALCVIVSKRSGGDTYWRRRWTPGKSASRELQHAMELLAGPLAERKVYEVRAVAARFAGGPTDNAPADVARALAGDVRRTLRRSDTGVTVDLADLDLDLAVDGRGPEELRNDIENWVGRMLVARLAASVRPRN